MTPSRSLAVVAVWVILLAGCGGDGTVTTITAAPSVAQPDCTSITELFVIADVAPDPGDSCRHWVDVSVGRLVRGSTGSAAVWSRRTPAGTALIVGAMHTLGEGWFGPSGTPIAEELTDPAAMTGVLRLHLTLPDGSGPSPLASPLFTMYHPSIAPERNNDLLRGLLPREDFYVGVADSQTFDVSMLSPTPDPLTEGLVPLFDPAGVTLADPTFASPAPEALVLMLGYPNATGLATAAVGRVLTDAEASRAVADLAAAGDPEGAIPYDPDVEMLIEGSAVAGMSGGPVVDSAGRLVGILVRASDLHDFGTFVRAVRMTQVVARIAAAVDALDATDRDSLAPYLEG